MNVQIFSTLSRMEMKDWIRAARNHARLTQTQLGDRLGLTKGNISAWEQGRHEASLDQLIRISELTSYPEPLPGISGAAKKVAARPETEGWPFADIDESKVRKLSSKDLAKLEGAIIYAAGQFGIDIKKTD